MPLLTMMRGSCLERRATRRSEAVTAVRLYPKIADWMEEVGRFPFSCLKRRKADDLKDAWV